MKYLRAVAVTLTALVFLTVRPALAELSHRDFALMVEGVIRSFQAADIDGDGLEDVLVTHVVIDEANRRISRFFSLFLQTKAGFPNSPTQNWEAPADAIAYDLANFDPGTPGAELGYISSAGVFYFKFDKDRFITAPNRLLTASTIFRRPDRHGIIAFDFAQDLDGDGTEDLVLPDFDQTYVFVLGPGENGPAEWRLSQIFAAPLRSRLSTPWENDVLFSRIEQGSARIEMWLPEIYTSDYDGNGRADVFVPFEDRLYVYRQTAEGVYEEAPVFIDFGILPLQRQMRHGHLPEITRLKISDFNGDGLGDVILSRLVARDLSSLDLLSWFYVFINKGGSYSARPDEEFTFEGFVEQPFLADYNGDGRTDIGVQRFPSGFSQFLRILLFSRVKIAYDVFYSGKDGLHTTGSPQADETLGFSFDLSNQSLSILTGFSFNGDYDGNGRLDLLQAADPDSYLFLLSTKEEWAANETRVTLPSSFLTFTKDLNGDDHDDVLVRYAGRGDLDSQVRILLSRTAR